MARVWTPIVYVKKRFRKALINSTQKRARTDEAFSWYSYRASQPEVASSVSGRGVGMDVGRSGCQDGIVAPSALARIWAKVSTFIHSLAD